MTSHKSRRTIRVLYANCPNLDEAACTYLILAQNAVQSVFEFEVYHLWLQAAKTDAGDYLTHLSRWLDRRSLPLPFGKTVDRRCNARLERLIWPPLRAAMPPSTAIEQLRPLLQKHDEWLQQLPSNYGNRTIRPAPTVVITETPFEGFYFGWSAGDLAIASVSHWRKRQTPPSLLEFILDQVQRYALRMGVNQRIGSHYPTRACIWDFDANVSDAKMSVLVGHLCGACEDFLLEQLSESELKEIRHLLSHTWIGRTDEPGSVASNLKRVFGYDLARTRGLSPSFLDHLRQASSSEMVRLIGAWLLAILTLLTGAWLKKFF
ncbi:MAG: hypothetical protein L0387_01235 [Acidobacteria bacterium]|nr:hypothetical protein [Acidobacteriota bacterium]